MDTRILSKVIPFDIVNYKSLMYENYTEAFKDKDVFDKYIKLLSYEADNVAVVLKQLIQERSIDTAVGKQLDIIGNIVGQTREIVNAEDFPYFAYEGAPLAQSYGDLNNKRFGGYYWDITKPLTGNVTLNDDQYRIFIKAKIMKNITRATPEDVISFIRFVFDVDSVQITNDFGGEATINLVGQEISGFTTAVIQQMTEQPYRSYFIPKTLGVKYNFAIIEGTGYFSYEGAPDGKGYGDLNNPSLGGRYSRLI